MTTSVHSIAKGPDPHCENPTLSESGFRLAAITRLVDASLAHNQPVYTSANRNQRCYRVSSRKCAGTVGAEKLVKCGFRRTSVKVAEPTVLPSLRFDSSGMVGSLKTPRAHFTRANSSGTDRNSSSRKIWSRFHPLTVDPSGHKALSDRTKASRVTWSSDQAKGG